MEHERFDDVSFRILETPEPAPRSSGRRGRWAIAATASVLAMGALATGAAGHGSAGDERATPPAAAKKGERGPCKRGEGKRHEWRDSAGDALRY